MKYARIVILVVCLTFLSSGMLMAQGGPVKIDFWYSVGGNPQKATQALVEKFNSSQNEVIVEAMYGGSYEDTFKKLLAAVVAGEAPVISHVGNTFWPQLALQGQLEVLSTYLSNDPTISESDFVEQLLEVDRYKGELYSLPFNRSTPVLYYNKDLYRSAGLDPENPPKLWDETFYEYVRKISAVGNDIVGFDIARGSGWITQAYTWQFGGDWIADDNSTVLWTDPPAVEALEFMQNMYNEGIATYEGGATLYSSEKCGMFMESTAALTNLIDSAPYDLGNALMPYKVRQQVPVGGGVLVIFKNASQPEKDAAWKFIKFMVSEESQIYWSKSTGYMACSTAALNSKELQDLWAKDPRFKTAYEQLPYIVAENRTFLIPFLEVRDFFNAAWDEAILNNKDAAKTLAEAQTKANDVLAEYGYR